MRKMRKTRRRRRNKFRIITTILVIVIVTACGLAIANHYFKFIDFSKEEVNKEVKKPTKKVEKVEEPPKELTPDEIKATLTDVLGSFETYYMDGTPQAANIENSASKLNGLLVAPGEEVSVNSKFEPYTAENGYQSGGTFENGEIVQSIGGGICQTSSTLYNALLYAEVKVTERYNHQMLVTYVDPSRDATISDTSQDLCFLNDTGNYIHIIAYAGDGVCNMTIYGIEYRDPRRSVEYQSVEISSEEPQTKYQPDESLPLGQIEESNQGKRGVVAELWKIYCYDGVETGREKWNTSRYQRLDNIVKIGIRKADGTTADELRHIINIKDDARLADAIRRIQEGNLEGF